MDPAQDIFPLKLKQLRKNDQSCNYESLRLDLLLSIALLLECTESIV